MSSSEKIEQHPSFAQISATRVTSTGCPPSNGTSMYGSKLKHSRYVCITIKKSELRRDINSDNYCDREQLIRVRMTENQFAQFITSMNMGGGTPCTIERYNGKGVEDPPYRNELAVVKTEFQSKAKEIAQTLMDAQKRLAAIIAPGGKASKAELNALRDEIDKAAREIGANMPYMAECFEETMDDVVTSAKTDIESYAADRFARAGISTGEGQAPVLLLDAEDDKCTCSVNRSKGWGDEMPCSVHGTRDQWDLFNTEVESGLHE